MRLERAVPVLQVADVGRSIDWDAAAFGIEPSPFPKNPLVRGPERMFYGLVEFEVLDPDGYRVCMSGAVGADANVPAAREREETAP